MHWPAPASPTDARPPVRWGLGDVVLLYLVALVASVMLGTAVAAVAGTEPGGETTDAVLGALLGGQFLALLGGLVLVSRRKGWGRLSHDFGLRLSGRGAWAIAAGVGLQIALALALLPLRDLAGDEAQSVVEELRDAGGTRLAILSVYAALLAPFIEEVFFRGLLLRSLQRRLAPAPAVAVSALAFASVHLTDPSIGTVAVLPGLVVVGVVSGVLAVRSGDLSRSIYLHFGFNLLTVAGTLTA